MLKLDAKSLRHKNMPEELKKNLKKELKKNPIYIILDNVLDTYNVGAIFRIADAVAVKKVYLCGETETPPNHRIKKASINTTEWVDWEYKKNTLEAIRELRSQVPQIKIIALEQDKKSVPYDQVDYQFPLAIIVGHETHGISREVLDTADHIAEIPMWGVNISLNVMISLGIALYKVMEHKDQPNT